ncbi:MAG TPA: DNA repair protein RadA [Acidimicrobiales bacterium]|nr:DNA repair protein RadA [Acidimicrobiales bacterium]
MPKLRTRYRCTDCHAEAPRWTGRCPDCGAWNSIVEDACAEGGTPPVAVTALGDVAQSASAPRPTGIGELDRVLGGGLVAGSVTLLGGEPGIGKSTLLLQALASIAARGHRALLVSAEESAHQVRLRAERLHAAPPSLWLASETDLARVLAAIGEVAPDVVVVDSIQTVYDATLGSGPGSVVQVQACAQALVDLAKQRDVSVVLVGHVTKDGSLAGPRALEHLVDTVLSFEGERHHALRLLRALKHRFGPTGELGLFEMGELGLEGVPDPSGLFLGDRQAGAPGCVVVPAMEGQRPLLVELQALVVPGTKLPQPRRSAQGLDAGRLSLLAAVLDRRAGISVTGADVYASAVGGVRIVEPAADLGVALALASSVTDTVIADDLVACGEIGLAGEVRHVAHLSRRLAEAGRLGFRRAVVPASAPDGPAGLQLLRVSTLVDALRVVGISAS